MAAVTRIGDGAYRVEVDGRGELVYVAGPPRDRWVFWRGQVFRGDFRNAAPGGSSPGTGPRAHAAHALAAPMPATVIRVAVKPGDAVQKGDIVLVLEAMKMELPFAPRATALSPRSAAVKATSSRRTTRW